MRRSPIPLALACVGALACEAKPEAAADPCDPSVFEAEQGFAAIGTDCGAVDPGSSVAEREAVRDCMLAADQAGEAAHALADSGVDSTSRWIVYLRPGEDPPAWGVSYTSDPAYVGPGSPVDQVSAYACQGIAATAECDENSPAFCIDCVGLTDESLWSCERS